MKTPMKIAVIPANAEKIEDLLKAVNGRSFQHTLTTYDEVEAQAEAAESKLDRLRVKKANRPGCEREHTSGGEVPNCYKGSRNATWIRLRRGSKHWYLIAVVRECLYKEGGKTHTKLPEFALVEAWETIKKLNGVSAIRQ